MASYFVKRENWQYFPTLKSARSQGEKSGGCIFGRFWVCVLSNVQPLCASNSFVCLQVFYFTKYFLFGLPVQFRIFMVFLLKVLKSPCHFSVNQQKHFWQKATFSVHPVSFGCSLFGRPVNEGSFILILLLY